MPVSITPSLRTRHAWCQYVRHPLRIEIVILAFSLLTLQLAVAGSTYDSMSGWGYEGSSPTVYYISYGPIGPTVSNLVAPLSTMMITSLDLYLYTRRTLRPGYALAMSLTFGLGWTAQIVLWTLGQFGASMAFMGEGFMGFMVAEPWALGIPKIIGGFAVFFTYFVYFVKSWITLVKRKPSVDNTESVHGSEKSVRSSVKSVDHSAAGDAPRSLPDYDDIVSVGAQRAAADNIEAQEKKPELADTCYCSNCGGPPSRSSVEP